MKAIIHMSIMLFICFSNALATIDRIGENIESSAGNSHSVFIPNSPLVLNPQPIITEIRIDGEIETIWRKNSRFGNFTEYEPIENRQPKVSTEGFVAFDADNLYVAFVCYDPDISKLRATLTDRDNIFEDDWVCVTIDPNQDFQMAYQLYANARGIQGDQLWQANRNNEDTSYDLVWQSSANIYNDRWIVEMKIPFESLRFPNHAEQNWSVHFTRFYPRDNEYKFSWMPITANNNSFIEQAGEIKFKMPERENVRRTLEFLPYTIATQENYREANTSSSQLANWQSERPDSRMGLGVKYGLSSNFIADFAYNPDFSHIEADEGQFTINNPFALFFTEKRPFFQEGSDIYAVDQYSSGIVLDQYVDLFYSRSINDPLVAGKVTGKAGKLSVGYTTAYDQNTPFIIPLEESSAVLATDKKSYNNIIRAKYDFRNQSSVGFFSSNRYLVDSGMNTVAAFDANIRISETHKASTIIAFTHTHEPDDPQLSEMIDSTTFEVNNEMKTSAFDGESFYGYLLRGKFQREAKHWSYTLAYQDFSPGFRADNGFIMVNSHRNFEGVTRYTFLFDNNKFFTSIEPRINTWRKYSYGNIVKDTGISPRLSIQLRKQIYIFLSGFLFNRENLRGKQFGDGRQVWIYVRSRMVKSYTPEFFIRIGEEINRLGEIGNKKNPFEIVPTLRYNLGLTLKPMSKFSNETTYQVFQLWQTFWSRMITGQRIFRNSFSYQFNKNLFVRLIAEYNIVHRYSSSNDDLIRRRYFTFDPLISYKLNAFSVFYFGGHIGAKDHLYQDLYDMRFNNQTFFIKFQYLFRL